MDISPLIDAAKAGDIEYIENRFNAGAEAGKGMRWLCRSLPLTNRRNDSSVSKQY